MLHGNLQAHGLPSLAIKESHTYSDVAHLPSPMRAHAATLLLLAACSSSGSAGAPDASPPGPYLLQFVGEYDDVTPGAPIRRVVLHADGALEATISGEALQGIFNGSGQPGDASASMRMEDGRTFAISFASTPATDVPAQVRASVGSQTLVGPWVAGGESMCDATGGTWRDDDPDPRTGLYCTCAARDLYMPSRGGCVTPSTSHDDPDRRRPADGTLDHVGSYEGTGTVSSLTLSRDGTYDATIDGRHDDGTWWDSPSLTGVTTIDCTGPDRAFRAMFQSDGTLTLHLGGGATETLRF